MTDMTDEDVTITGNDIAFFMMEQLESQRRVYDCLLTLIAAIAGDEAAVTLQETHERNEFLYPPAWVENTNNDKDEHVS